MCFNIKHNFNWKLNLGLFILTLLYNVLIIFVYAFEHKDFLELNNYKESFIKNTEGLSYFTLIWAILEIVNNSILITILSKMNGSHYHRPYIQSFHNPRFDTVSLANIFNNKQSRKYYWAQLNGNILMVFISIGWILSSSINQDLYKIHFKLWILVLTKIILYITVFMIKNICQNHKNKKESLYSLPISYSKTSLDSFKDSDFDDDAEISVSV